jgi:hypothetical protein
MKRLVPFLFTLLLLPVMVKGQISVDPSSFILTGNPSQTDITYHITVTNTTPQTANLFWSFRMTGNPATWLTWVCDRNLCYTPETTSCPANKPNILLPNESMDLQIHMNPRETEGTADYLISILNESGNILFTVDGDFLISQTSAVTRPSDTKLTVYPNPTPDYFQVSELPGLRYIELYNIIGNKMKSFDAVPQKQYYVGDLNEGIYLVRLVASNGKVLKTVRLSKR